jgi:hypothetical protein
MGASEYNRRVRSAQRQAEQELNRRLRAAQQQAERELKRQVDAYNVWLVEVAIRPGKSMALQMDQGLRKARAGVVVLTPAYLTGRFWTERELGALLHKDILIPVLHAVTFDDVKEYSGILPDLVGFTTENDTIAEIAAKIASAVLVPVS